MAVAPLTSQAERTSTEETKATETQNEVVDESSITNFSNFNVSYLGGYEDFGHGYYGIGYDIFSPNGFAFSLSFHGSWGIVDDGQYMFRLGFGYGYAVTKWLAITGMVKGMYGSYTEYGTRKGTVSYPSWTHQSSETTYTQTKESKSGGGILAVPGLRIKGGKFVIGVNFDLGWAKFGSSGFYKDVQLSVGYNF